MVDGRPFGFMNWTDAMLYQRAVHDVHDGTVVEIGAFLGRSLSFVAPVCWQNHNRLFAIDPWEWDLLHASIKHALGGVHRDLFLAFRRNMEDLGHWKRLDAIRATSVQAAEQFPDTSVDLIFIDGDHDRDAVVADIEAWRPKMKAGGKMMGHDWHLPSVRQPVLDILGNPDEPIPTVWKVTV
jgi:cephalosporin hydroxylase